MCLLKRLTAVALTGLFCFGTAACARTENDSETQSACVETAEWKTEIRSETVSAVPGEVLSEEPSIAADREELPNPAAPIGIESGDADEICRRYGAVGVEIAVIRNGVVVGTYTYGYADKSQEKKVTPDTKFRIASLSKLATDMIFMALCDEGLCDPDANISQYLGYTVENPYHPDVPITPKMLMTHTSSLQDSSQFLSSRQNASSVPMQTLLQSAGSFSAAEPGTACSYSNFGVAVIGAICEKAASQHFYELADQYLFRKLGIDASFTASDLQDTESVAVLYGYGGYTLSQQFSERFCEELGQTHHLVQGNLTISAKDYAELLCLLINGGTANNGTQVLSRESCREILTDHFDDGEKGMGYGLWQTDRVVDGTSLFVHTGSNFGMFSSFAFSADSGDGVVVFTSGADGVMNNTADMRQVCLDLIRYFYEYAV